MFANLTVTFLLFLILVLNLLLPLELFVYLRLIIFNSLPLYIRSSDSLATFISRLKSHLFSFFLFFLPPITSSHSHASASRRPATIGAV